MKPALTVPMLLLGMAAGCERTEETRSPEPVNQDGQHGRYQEDDLRGDEGRLITVSGNVEAIEGPRQFQLDGSAWPWDHQIPVFARSAVDFVDGGLQEGDELIVTGELRRLVVPDIDHVLGWDLTLKTKVDLGDRPILIAQAVTRVTNSDRWMEPRPLAHPSADVNLSSSPDP